MANLEVQRLQQVLSEILWSISDFEEVRVCCLLVGLAFRLSPTSYFPVSCLKKHLGAQIIPILTLPLVDSDTSKSPRSQDLSILFSLLCLPFLQFNPFFPPLNLLESYHINCRFVYLFIYWKGIGYKIMPYIVKLCNSLIISFNFYNFFYQINLYDVGVPFKKM